MCARAAREEGADIARPPGASRADGDSSSRDENAGAGTRVSSLGRGLSLSIARPPRTPPRAAPADAPRTHAMGDVAPCATIYVNNLNEKIKKDGAFASRSRVAANPRRARDPARANLSSRRSSPTPPRDRDPRSRLEIRGTTRRPPRRPRCPPLRAVILPPMHPLTRSRPLPPPPPPPAIRSAVSSILEPSVRSFPPLCQSFANRSSRRFLSSARSSTSSRRRRTSSAARRGWCSIPSPRRRRRCAR